jgi:hypothetical protein
MTKKIKAGMGGYLDRSDEKFDLLCPITVCEVIDDNTIVIQHDEEYFPGKFRRDKKAEKFTLTLRTDGLWRKEGDKDLSNEVHGEKWEYVIGKREYKNGWVIKK